MPIRNQEDQQGQTTTSRDMPRSILSRDARSVDRLLSALSLGGPAAAAAWRFLMRLPTNPDMLSVVRSLEGIRSEEESGISNDAGRNGAAAAVARAKWKSLLGSPGSHRMLYMLQIVEGVLESIAGYGVGGGASNADMGESACRGKIENRSGVNCVRWATDFVRSHGFGELCAAVLTRGLFGDGHPESMVDVQQACLVRRQFRGGDSG